MAAISDSTVQPYRVVYHLIEFEPERRLRLAIRNVGLRPFKILCRRIYADD